MSIETSRKTSPTGTISAVAAVLTIFAVGVVAAREALDGRLIAAHFNFNAQRVDRKCVVCRARKYGG